MRKREGEKKKEPPEVIQAREEQKLLEALESRKKLKSDYELAKGIEFLEPIKTSWRPPKHLRDLSEEEIDKIKKKHHIDVDGEDIPPPAKRFKDMRLPKSILENIKSKGISKPTPIQMQGIPVV